MSETSTSLPGPRSLTDFDVASGMKEALFVLSELPLSLALSARGSSNYANVTLMSKRRYGRTPDVNPDPGSVQHKTLRTWQHERDQWDAAAAALGLSFSEFARRAFDTYSQQIMEEAA